MSLRYKLLMLTWLLQFVNYLDRVSISVAAPSMMKALHLDAAQLGVIFAAFALGYALMQLPGGMLSDRFGTKALLVVAPLLFSLFTGLTGLVSSVAAMVMVRFCFGLSEGSCNAAVYKLVADNFSSKDAARAHSVWLSALAIGPAVVAPVVVWLLVRGPWQHVFFFFAIPGVVVSLLIFLLIPPQVAGAKSSAVDRAERRAHWKTFIRLKSTWLLFFGYMTFSIGYWGFLGWVPSYLSVQRHIDLKALGFAASIPYLFGFLGLIVFGTLGSGALHRKRPVMLAAGYTGTAIALYFTFTADDPALCIAGLSAAAFLLYGSLSPYAALVAHLAPEGARGGYAGFINTGGQIGGLTAPLVVGGIVKASGSYNGGFVFMISALLIGAVCFVFLQSQVSRRQAPLVNARA
ncbi:major facilitator transporter [Caballeronia choica]|uniref:Major facilitator transporter n=1 Tax=Caballeronia choica TaxID=326476 RepID=A0A158K9Q1_9BURK|nr:MFS transporter [Caballeronia choica]SAL77181.1 major facilitator transporter [Caballeronia choica]